MADSTNQNLFWWDRDDFLKLVPKTVQQQGDHLVLTAETRGQTWTIDFVNDQGQWKIDWVHGYTPRVVSDHPGATPTPTASTWQDRCNAVYRLGDNEILKRIAPPFISERKSYYAAAAPDQAERIPEPPTRIVFHWDGELRLLGMTFGGPPTLESVLNFALGLASFEYSGPDALLKREVTGDWIVRPDAPLPARVQALAHILTTALGRPIQFEKRPVEREVIVAKGTFTFGPLAAAQPTTAPLPPRMAAAGAWPPCRNSFVSSETRSVSRSSIRPTGRRRTPTMQTTGPDTSRWYMATGFLPIDSIRCWKTSPGRPA